MAVRYTDTNGLCLTDYYGWAFKHTATLEGALQAPGQDLTSIKLVEMWKRCERKHGGWVPWAHLEYIEHKNCCLLY